MLLCGDKTHFLNHMYTLLGEYEVAIDAKGRFLLPAGFRKQLPAEEAAVGFVLKRGFENCLELYPMASWKALSAQLEKLNPFNPKVREFKRILTSGANTVEPDSAGRLLIPKTLQDFAGITKEMVLVAQGDKAEIWDKKTYYDYITNHSSSFSALAEEVAGGNFMNPFDQN